MLKSKISKYKNTIRVRLTRFIIYGIACPLIYNINKYKKVQENKVVFIELRHNELTNSFETLYNTLRNDYTFEVHCHFMNLNKKSRKALLKRIIDLLEDVATAKYVFLNESNTIFSKINVRKETKVIQLWHGCGAFKKFGYSTAEFIFGATKKEMDKYPTSKNIDLITVSSKEVIWAYEEALDKPKGEECVKALGVSRTDIFFKDESKENARNKLETLFPEAKGKKVILYAPTFRGRVAKAIIPDMLRIEEFQEQFKEEYVLLYKYHPLVKKKPSIKDSCQSFAKNMTELMTIEELLCVTDICISDYSSLIYEFSLFEKPMAFFAYDLDDFCDWRGFYYDYSELTPGPVCKTNGELINYIKNIDTVFDKEKVVAFKNKFMESCDGRATERIMNEVFGENLSKYRKKNQTKYNYAKLLNGKSYFSELKNKMPDVIENNLDIQVKGKRYTKDDASEKERKILIVYKPVFRTWVGLETQKVYLDLQYLAERLTDKAEIHLVLPEKGAVKVFPMVKYLHGVIKTVEGEIPKCLIEEADLIILDYDIDTFKEVKDKTAVYFYQPDRDIYELYNDSPRISSDKLIKNEDEIIELINI